MDDVRPEGFLYCRREAVVFADFQTTYKEATGLDAVKDELRLIRTWEDEIIGKEHRRYQQYHKNLRVEHALLTEHGKEGFVELINGVVCEGLDLNVVPALSEATALDKALRELAAKRYAWQDNDWEQELKEDTDDLNATYYPEGELLIALTNGNSIKKDNYRLAWLFYIRAIDPSALTAVYIDAQTGDLLRRSEQYANFTGTADLMHGYGTRVIDTDRVNNRWILRATDNGRDIHTKIGHQLSGWGGVSNVTNTTNAWGTTHQEATTTHWAATQAWDFFANVYNRRGSDGQGRPLRVYAGADLIPGSRFLYDPVTPHNGDKKRDYVEIGYQPDPLSQLPTGPYMAAIDIIGHEYTHAVTRQTANFDDRPEPGALDESFADIFGFMVERYTQNGVVVDWLLGEDAPPLKGDMSNPGAHGHPSVYLGAGWVVAPPGCVPGVSGCGIHRNAFVQNYWFYLLSQGSVPLSVQGIGVSKAALIAYYNLTNMLTSNSTYPDACQGAIASAQMLYGRCSNEEAQTTNAWAAVGIGQSAPPCIDIVGPNIRCKLPFFGHFPFALNTRRYPTNAVVTWSGFPNSWQYSFTGFGNQSVSVNSAPPSSINARAEITVNGLVYLDTHPVLVRMCVGNFKTTAAPDEPAVQSAKAYPNPAGNALNIALPEDDGIEHIAIFSIHGTLLERITGNGTSLQEIDIAHLPAGNYLIQVRTNREALPFNIIKID